MKPRYISNFKYALGLIFLSIFSYNTDSGYSKSIHGPDSSKSVIEKADYESMNNPVASGGTLDEQADSALSMVNRPDSSMRIICLSTNYTTSESGYGPGVDMRISIERENRLLGTGIIMQQSHANIYGGEVFYRHYLSSIHSVDKSGNNNYRAIRFYLQYNFIFRKKNLQETFDLIYSPEASGEPAGRVATFEHYAGGGIQAKIIGKLFLNADIGYGLILGSLSGEYNNEPHYTMGGRRNDYGLILEFGTGYFFGN